MQQWLKKWRRLQDKQKNQTIILILAIVVVGYAFTLYAPGKKKMQFSQNMVDRQENRLQKQRKQEIANLPDIGTLKRKIKRLEEEVGLAQIESNRYELRQAPIGDSEIMQGLREGITNLALQSGVRVVSSKDAGIHTEEGEAPDGEEALKAQTKNVFGRPQILLKASASFSQLMDFLNALPSLDYEVSVARMGLQTNHNDVGDYRSEKFSASNRAILDVNLLIAL